MADRTVSVKLVADAQAYIRGVEAAERKTREATQTVEQQLAKQREAYNTVGVAAVAVGAAITGIGVAALKTGIEYNTLQQTTRAALSTLLGSAEAANAQMDRLDDFARNSPFSKQVFIEAQQQLLGFGMEAERVVPTLDAIQNAVAATGGSNQDIAELVRIIAQLEGGVKISAETFNQFGARGIDAAQLIGDAMGKTGEQIRSEVTAGTLDADQAIQALTDGMSARFGGAADNVKNTFEGAMDRVKAAWRDFASELARPLVNPNGGGMLVDALNWAADMMRAFEALPAPIKEFTGILAGAVGAVALLGGAALLAVPQIASFRAALETLNIPTSRVRGALGGVAGFLTGPWGVALLAAATGVKILNDSLGDLTATASEFQNALTTGDGSSVLSVLTDGLAGESFGTELEVIQHLLDVTTSDFQRMLNAPFGNMSSFNRFRDNLKTLDTALSGLPLEDATEKFHELQQQVGASPEQVAALVDEMPMLKAELDSVASALGVTITDMSEYEQRMWYALAATGEFRDAQGNVVSDADLVAAGVEGVTTELEAQEIAAADAAETLNELAEATRAAYDEQVALFDLLFTEQNALAASGDAYRDLTAAIEEGLTPALLDGGDGFDTFEESGAEAATMFEDLISSTNDASIAMAENGATSGEVATYQRDMRQSIYDAGIEMGLSKDAAAAYRDMILMVPTELFTDVDINTDTADAELWTFVNQKRVAFVDVEIGSKPDYAHPPGGTGSYTGFAGGGRLPGAFTGKDDRLGFDANGNVFGLAGSEWIIGPAMSSKYDDILRQINAGTFPGYADGGRLTPNPPQPQVVYVNGGSAGHSSVSVSAPISMPRTDPNVVIDRLGVVASRAVGGSRG